MASIHVETPNGRDFTASELIGRRILIEGPVPKRGGLPTGREIRIIVDDELMNNACKAVLTLAANEVTEAKITLYRHDLPDAPKEEITLRDHIELSFSAIVSEVQ